MLKNEREQLKHDENHLDTIQSHFPLLLELPIECPTLRRSQRMIPWPDSFHFFWRQLKHQ